jgi:hypothetical protein
MATKVYQGRPAIPRIARFQGSRTVRGGPARAWAERAEPGAVLGRVVQGVAQEQNFIYQLKKWFFTFNQSCLMNDTLCQFNISQCLTRVDTIPSGKRLHSYGKIHHAINGKIHYFDWVIFNSYVTNYQRVTFGSWNLLAAICSMLFHFFRGSRGLMMP